MAGAEGKILCSSWNVHGCRGKKGKNARRRKKNVDVEETAPTQLFLTKVMY
ncbi:hypothetical protein TIFTF001_011153 [Ficus carica]|uniref:Uncharacterized protein n=1 Tax=Ficus carica TaxID=3494 RepID=A0AA88DHU2_FICCA|nr:hypothetical protein TIFTF001_011153 [Ficus carica]